MIIEELRFYQSTSEQSLLFRNSETDPVHFLACVDEILMADRYMDILKTVSMKISMKDQLRGEEDFEKKLVITISHE